MKLGLSVDSKWIWGVVIDDNDKSHYRNQLKTPVSAQQTAALISSMALSMQRMFGPLTLVGINLMPDCWHGQEQTSNAKEALSDWLAIQLSIPYQLFDPAVIALSLMPSLPKGNVLSAILDDGCELCVTDQICPTKPYLNVLDLGWAHKPLKGYQSLVDGLTPLCSCGSDECVRQYLSREGIERQYHQLSLQNRDANDIIHGIEENHNWSTRVYRIWIDQLARALSDAIIRFKPKLLVLSGSLTSHPDLALTLKSTLSRYCQYDSLPEIICLHNNEYGFAQGAISMCTVNCAQSSTFIA
ncbi:hypothetical protein C1N32_06065 [Vibrio diazotrophicus]|uniref:ROK family protein n=1 Tax=Vibrio diazotrophicus TaxID=685 RepID=A0A2J8I599_VIBDI|nr:MULTISPECIES: ROK family protein [Vibrio]MCF7361790.1 ROK family protein [Vibrio sp. A1-b2]PNI05661.1 hypothetical protein C1N32_06065 [Vibrio diazotrophicus]